MNSASIRPGSVSTTTSKRSDHPPRRRVSPGEDLSQMAQVLAHRIRGLVTGIEGYTDLLIDTLATREQREFALRILESAARIEQVLSDLQRFGRDVAPVVRPLPLKVVIEELLAAMADEDLERIGFDVKEGTDLSIEADPVLLRQALLILLQNALDATRHGGAILFATEMDRASHAMAFVVRNDGHMAVEDAEVKVFAPFFTTKAHNLGVGLTLARRIARAHRGSLRLTSNDPEAGTAFTLTLPLSGGAS